MRHFKFCLYLLAFLAPAFAFADPPCEDFKNCSYKFQTGENYLRYYSTFELLKENRNIKRIVIVVHGALRNGHEYFNDTVKAAKKNNSLNTVLVLAPHFKKVTDQREEGEHYWGRRWYHKWKYGYKSEDTDQISSFAIMDNIIKSISGSGSFPNLKTIVLTGHSAGGQFTQRFAVGSKVRSEIKEELIIAPSNPSSYMYLSAERYDFNQANYDPVPPKAECSKEFNEYIYGPINRASYLNQLTVNELTENFKKQKVVYLMSEEDKGVDSLDRSCEAMAQGKNRIERAQNFFYYVKKHITSTGHKFVSIPNVGHEHIDVYESKEAAEIIFGIKKDKTNSFLTRKIGQWSIAPRSTEKQFVMFGGGRNEYLGMQAFLKSAKGGNLLVISGKSNLNHRYTHDFWRMSKEMSSIPLSAVTSISFLRKEAGSDPFVIKKIKEADAIFFTGGNQSKYINRIKNTPAHLEIIAKSVAIAGSSAGLAIMGEYIFSAVKGGVSSNYVLRNPHSDYISLEHDFFYSSLLKNLVTDTHFMEREREGRLIGFMFKSQYSYGLEQVFGLGIDEETSLHILPSGNMLANGVGDVFLYKASDIFVERQQASLSYGPIAKKVLTKKVIHPHYSLIRSDWNVLTVNRGRILSETF